MCIPGFHCQLQLWIKNNTRTWPSSVSLTQDMWLVQVQYYMNTCAFTDAHITFNIFQENFQIKYLKVLASKTCSEQGTSLFHRIIIHLNTISLSCMYVYLYVPQRRSSSADRTVCSVIGTTCSCHSEAFPMSCSRYHDNKQSQKPIPLKKLEICTASCTCSKHTNDEITRQH